jgi:hypothetical protein
MGFHQSAKLERPAAHASCYFASREESQTGAAAHPLAELLSLCRGFLAQANRPPTPDTLAVPSAQFWGYAFLQ